MVQTLTKTLTLAPLFPLFNTGNFLSKGVLELVTGTTTLLQIKCYLCYMLVENYYSPFLFLLLSQSIQQFSKASKPLVNEYMVIFSLFPQPPTNCRDLLVQVMSILTSNELQNFKGWQQLIYSALSFLFVRGMMLALPTNREIQNTVIQNIIHINNVHISNTP